jgi:protein-S-isoprenylcysteine O-methyltransferase Ste14
VSRLPTLGTHGEGWVTGQVLLLAAVGVAGVVDRPDWDGDALAVSTVVGLGLVVAGLVIGIVGVRDLGPSLTPVPRPKDGAALVQKGIYGWVRHPLYLGLVLGALGWALFSASLLGVAFTVALAVFLDLKARREEVWLRERYPLYAHYARRVRRFVPGVY